MFYYLQFYPWHPILCTTNPNIISSDSDALGLSHGYGHIGIVMELHSGLGGEEGSRNMGVKIFGESTRVSFLL